MDGSLHAIGGFGEAYGVVHAVSRRELFFMIGEVRFGGTPSNLAISVMEETRAEVIAGLNLPMLIKLASVRGREPLEACVAHAQDAGRKYISVASWVLQGEK